MRLDYVINEMIKKVDWAIINTYFVDKKKRKRK